MPRRSWPFVLFAAIALPAFPQGLSRLAEGWEYRWGDSPVAADGSFLWSGDGAGGWKAIAAPTNPPGRAKQTRVWYRVRLPRAEAADARLFVNSIDLAAEFFLEGRLIYRWGDPGAAAPLPFRGWPWHLVALPRGYGGKLLSIRVASDYHDIGLWGDLLIGSGYDQIARVAVHDALRMLVATVSLLIALIFAVLYARRRQTASLLLAAMTAVLVVRVVSRTLVKQLVLDAPLLWEYVQATSSLLVVALVARLLQELLEHRYRLFVRLLAVGLLVLCVAVLTASAAGLVRLCDTYRILDTVMIASMAVLGVLSVKAAWRGETEARLLAGNFSLLALLAFYSILVSNSVLPWRDEIDYLLLFQFSAGLALILVRRFAGFQSRLEEYAVRLSTQAEDLRVLNDGLEQKVAERTRQLERANRRLREEKISLQITSITDGLTGLHNRTYTLDTFEKEIGKARRYGKRLSVIMFDLDYFKQVNDSFGHQAGDLVMQRFGGLLRDILRESDLAGRYGGEEFLVVLPETDALEATRVAERVRAETAALVWPNPEMRLTVSGGVAQFAGDTGDQLLQRADYLLYKAKESGRNRIATEATAAELAGGREET